MTARTRRLFIGLAFWLVAQPSPRTLAFAVSQEESLGPPPGTSRITPAADSIRIPFEVVEGEIRLNGRVNGREARMLVDNGALWDQLLFFGSPKVDGLDLKREGVIQVGGAGSGDPITADMASDISLRFDGKDGRTIEFEGQPGVIMPYDSGKPNPWAVAEGQVSSAFFKGFAVGFNFDEGIMTLVRPAAFDPKGKGIEVPLKAGNDGGWTIPCAITLLDGRRLALDATMDLGWDDPVAINTGQAHHIELPQGLKKTRLGSGTQGAIFGFYGSVRRLEIGGFTLDNVPATYSTVEEGGAKVAEIMVGLGTFQRFHVIFDYPRRRLFLKPNRKFGEPFDFQGLHD